MLAKFPRGGGGGGGAGPFLARSLLSPSTAILFESETVLKLYNLEAKMAAKPIYA